jgi:2-hydroxychromene-2-carboxylate isomerase
MNRKTILLVITLIVLGALFGCMKRPGQEKGSKDGDKKTVPSPGALDVELYVMSQCPYGVMALDSMLPAVEKLDGAVNLKLDYIGQNGPDGSPKSMHGESEVAGDILHLCAGEEAGPKQQYQFIACLNKDWRSIPKNWEQCAGEAGIDPKVLGKCKDGEKGKQLLLASFERASKAGAMGSPTIKVNGSPYKGGRKTEDFMRGFCAAIPDGKKPKACGDIPEPPKVPVTAISDKRCKECEAEKIVESLKGVFMGLEPRFLDWSDAEAKAIAKEAGVKLLPAILFDETMEKDKDGAAQMARWLEPAGKYKSLRVGAKFDPTAEICDNKIDDTGDGKTDCEDATCKETLACREAKPGRLDLFVMSQCPYGVLGFNAMKEILDAFGSELSFGVHYIADETPDGFRALHGQPEVDENIRELCAIKHYPDNHKFMDYIWCRNENIRSSDWKPCTGKNGIATNVIEKCSTGEEGKKLLSENIKLAQTLNVGGSPTWLINNQATFNGIAAKDIQKNICEKNPDLKGCKKELKEAPAAPKGSCGS